MKKDFNGVNLHIKKAIENGSRQFNNNVGNFRNAIGPGQPWRNSSGSRNAMGNDTPFNYNAGGSMDQSQLQPQSQPYIIQVANASATSASVQLFGANTHLAGYGTFSAGTLTTAAGVIVSTTLINTTYQGLLYQTISSSLMSATTRILVTTGTQLPSGVNWNNTDQGNGNTTSGTLVFPKSDFQQLTTQVTSYTAYPMNGNTTLTFTIAASTTLEFWIYPQTVVDASNAVTGQAPVQGFSSPGINGAGTFNVR